MPKKSKSVFLFENPLAFSHFQSPCLKWIELCFEIYLSDSPKLSSIHLRSAKDCNDGHIKVSAMSPKAWMKPDQLYSY